MKNNAGGITIPALPNWFPYNELLLSGKLSAKSRDWQWHHTGLVLLYTSTRVDSDVARAHGLDPKAFQKGVLVGVGELLPVRPLTSEERRQILNEFSNGGHSGWFGCGHFRYEFTNLKRFAKPVPFTPPQGAVSVLRVPLDLVAEALEEIGVSL